MLLQFETTFLFLLWGGMVAIATGYLSFVSKRSLHKHRRISHHLHFPAMILGPLAVFAVYRLLHINLFFPTNFFADPLSLWRAAAVPAFLLCISSGLVNTIHTSVTLAAANWERKAFVRFNRATGIDPRRGLRRIVLLQGLLQGWGQCLPWFFCELVVIEIIFNAPGFGLYAWQMARMRNYAGLGLNIAGLASVFLLCSLATHQLHSWIGRRLETYD